MSWSFRIGRLAGIDVRVHATFVMLIAWVGLSGYLADHSVRAGLGSLVLILLVFAIIVLHELGHALTARRFGIRTRDITLLPIGGVARLEKMPEKPLHELLVALAGPAVNGVLALLLYGIAQLANVEIAWRPPRSANLLSELVGLNVGIMVFNLLPAFPMDGGRALRALLALRMDNLRATQIAASIGEGMALFFGLIGLFTNTLLVFVAMFVWMGASSEARMAKVSSALEGIPVSAVMVRHFQVLARSDLIASASVAMLSGFQPDFPVIEQGHLVGLLTREELLQALHFSQHNQLVGERMQREFAIAEPGEMLSSALARLQSSGCGTLPVVQDGELVGIVTMQNVGELVALRVAAQRRRSGRA